MSTEQRAARPIQVTHSSPPFLPHSFVRFLLSRLLRLISRLAQYGSDGDSVSPLCGAKMNVWSPDSNVTISVKVGDICNACVFPFFLAANRPVPPLFFLTMSIRSCPTTTSIDLSQAAFLRLAGASPKNRDAALDKGVVSIQWWLEDAGLQAQLPIGFSDWDGSMGETNEST